MHGSPVCVEQVPPPQVSVPLQKRLSVQAAPLGSGARQSSAASLHDSEQSPSPSAPGQGSPVWVEQVPPPRVSVRLQKRLSVQTEPLGSGARQSSPASLHDSEQLPSPSGPGHGSPVELVHVPDVQVSVPLQKRPSVQAEPLGSGARQLSAASLHDSAQLPSPSAPGQGSPVWVEQVPPPQVSVPLQKSPSAQTEPLGSGARQLSEASLHDSAQLPSPSAPGQGSPVWVEQVPPPQVSVPLQKSPSAQTEPLGSGARQLSEASLQDSEQLPSPSGPGHGLPVVVQVPL